MRDSPHEIMVSQRPAEDQRFEIDARHVASEQLGHIMAEFVVLAQRLASIKEQVADATTKLESKQR